MECEKARERFSSLLEGKLNPLEEKMVREHLASCSECQKDLERFDKTVQWLHSVEEVEMPDGFLSGIYKKMEDRKRKALTNEKVIWKWLIYPLSLKLPIQAMAMVAILFLVIYLTKMMSVEAPHLKDIGQTEAPLSIEQKKEKVLVPKEMKEERRAAKPSIEESRLKEFGEPKAPLSEEKIIPLTAKPPQEIILRTSNRERVISQIHELVKQFGGEIVKEEGNILLASLPVASLSEFKKELTGLSSPKKADKIISQKDAMESLGVASGVKKRESKEKGKEVAKPVEDSENRITVQILLLQE